MWKKYGMLCSEQEGCAFYTAAAEFGCRALMMVGITTGIRYDENGQEIFVDLPEREHAQVPWMIWYGWRLRRRHMRSRER